MFQQAYSLEHEYFVSATIMHEIAFVQAHQPRDWFRFIMYYSVQKIKKTQQMLVLKQVMASG